jgi:hypothetical protein
MQGTFFTDSPPPAWMSRLVGLKVKPMKYAWESLSREELLKRMGEAVSNMAKNSGKTEQQVMDDMLAWTKLSPDERELSNLRMAMEQSKNPKDKQVFAELIVQTLTRIASSIG